MSDSQAIKPYDVCIASDHAGFDQKQQLLVYLAQKGLSLRDAGPLDDRRVDYPDYAQKVAAEVASRHARFGVLVCGTGIGMAIAANKVTGVRAANATTPDFAALARQHNDANVLTLSGRFVSIDTNKAIVDAFLSAQFEGGRHADRVQKIINLEQS